MRVQGRVRPSPRSDKVREVDLPGVTPSRQKRSREMTLALLQAGAEMLRTRSLSELSIEALCKKVGATVGAFYSRFDSKEAYFNALIELAARDGDRGLSRMAGSEPFRGVDLAELCGLMVSGIADVDSKPRRRAARRAPAWRHAAGPMDAVQAPGARHDRARHAAAACCDGQRPRGRQEAKHRLRLPGGVSERWSMPSSTIPARSRSASLRWRRGLASACCRPCRPR